jgi:superfamily II DNA helicase RecQ
MDALRDFAMSTNGCRRASLLTFFEETPSFGKYCGTCDLCVSRKDHGDDYERASSLCKNCIIIILLHYYDCGM